MVQGDQTPLSETTFAYTRREPPGVCAGIGNPLNSDTNFGPLVNFQQLEAGICWTNNYNLSPV